MNRTNTIGIVGQKAGDVEKAQTFFKNWLGEDVQYNTDKDVFIYKNTEFDYFKCGISIDPNGLGSFCFLDPRNPMLYLWNDEKLNDFFNGVPPMKTGWETPTPKTPSLLERFFNKLFAAL